MGELSYIALPTAEKRQRAIELKADGLSYTKIAEKLGVARSSATRWIDSNVAARDRAGAAVRMRALRMPVAPQLKKSPCGCTEALTDSLADRYFKRPTTCVLCGKRAKR